MIEKCPYCNSENIYYSKKRKKYVCEDCDCFFEEEIDSPRENEGYNLFFSYGHDKNRPIVERIKHDLEARGHKIWIDTSEIKAGTHWRDEIAKGILKSSGVVAFLSEHSTRDPGVCLDELKIAVCVKGAQIKTVLLEPEEKVNQPSTVADIQWLDMSRWEELKTNNDRLYISWYKQKIEELYKAIESKSVRELDGEIKFLKARLDPYLNSEKEYRLLSNPFYGRTWLKQFVTEWISNSTEKALVIYGKPGSGKSAFCVNFAHYNSSVFDCFLCEWDREHTTDPNRLIRTIAFRLASKIPDYRRLIVNQLADNSQEIDNMRAEDLFEYLLGYPLNHLIDGNRETGVLIIDGIDEADKGEENAVAELLEKSIYRLPRWIKFIFTSRPERNVVERFGEIESIDIIRDMPDDDNDVRLFILGSLKHVLKDSLTKMQIINKIESLCENIMLCAELIIKDFEEGSISADDINGMPNGLMGYYRASMDRKFGKDNKFETIRSFLEILVIDEDIPEQFFFEVCGIRKYDYIKIVDLLGSFLEEKKGESGLVSIGFSHKSIRDWFTNFAYNRRYYVSRKDGAAYLSEKSRHYLKANESNKSDKLMSYIENNIGSFYAIAEDYNGLENLMIDNQDNMDPIWYSWMLIPKEWNQRILIKAFWESKERNSFLKKLQIEGNTEFLQMIFEKLKDEYGIEKFDHEMMTMYVDIIHLSGEYKKAVQLAKNYIGEKDDNAIAEDDFLSLLNVRRIHNSMFFSPVDELINEAIGYSRYIEQGNPSTYNELLFLIGGNLGLLSGDVDFCRFWLKKSEEVADKNGYINYKKRNARKLSDLECIQGHYEEALRIIEPYLNKGRIDSRYEAYLLAARGNVLTCMDEDDRAVDDYHKVLEYTLSKGIPGWVAHSYLGIGNVYHKIGNYDESYDYVKKAHDIYKRINQAWGLMMSEALLSACSNRDDIALLEKDIHFLLQGTKKMKYGSCTNAIIDFFENKDCLELYFL